MNKKDFYSVLAVLLILLGASEYRFQKYKGQVREFILENEKMDNNYSEYMDSIYNVATILSEELDRCSDTCPEYSMPNIPKIKISPK